ncbi:MAG: hypothetical protein NT062_32390 [Proteobacteria bacterium]|nr:hypothetical protein [Pseudomonadota bacterium]
MTLLTILAGALAGCLGQASYTATGSSDGSYGGADLVYAAPGVEVIADYDESIFFADSFYWRYDSGAWYRSSRYNGGWAVYASPPQVVLRIEQPRAYAHYRPQGWVARKARPQPSPPVVRDHRQAPAPGPVVRDHRDPLPVERPSPPRRVPPAVERKDDRKDDRKDERKDDRKNERKDDRKDPRKGDTDRRR